jgi:hypothetical protein
MVKSRNLTTPSRFRKKPGGVSRPQASADRGAARSLERSLRNFSGTVVALSHPPWIAIVTQVVHYQLFESTKSLGSNKIEVFIEMTSSWRRSSIRCESFGFCSRRPLKPQTVLLRRRAARGFGMDLARARQDKGVVLGEAGLPRRKRKERPPRGSTGRKSFLP